jgi:hypothetical protein
MPRSVVAIAIIALSLLSAVSCWDDPLGPENPSPEGFTTSDLTVSGITVGSPHAAEEWRTISFDIRWSHSWRTSAPPANWDAAWIFIKYRTAGTEWRHATLSAVAAEHSAPVAATVSPAADGKGVFLYRSGEGSGAFHVSGVSLRWNHRQDGVDDAAAVEVRVFGIEMVYIPQGSFYAGDNGASLACFVKGSSDDRPWFIECEDAIEVTDTTANGYYYQSAKDFWDEIWNAHEDVTGTEFTIPAGYPKGYRAIYCMKYEMTQQQYADFLNTLTAAQAASRYDGSNFDHWGYTIKENGGVFSTEHPRRACGFIAPADGFAYADWAGLRPMSELEFEKICRGSGNAPIPQEFAWGTTYRRNAADFEGTEDDRELFTDRLANSYSLEENVDPRFPLNAGIFADTGKSRELSGAAFYGVLEMSGNLHEPCVTVGNRYGRAFTHRNGDGRLAADGSANEPNWPGDDGIGTGFRGGTMAEEWNHMMLSDRAYASNGEIDASHRHIPWGFRGVRTIP